MPRACEALGRESEPTRRQTDRGTSGDAGASSAKCPKRAAGAVGLGREGEERPPAVCEARGRRRSRNPRQEGEWLAEIRATRSGHREAKALRWAHTGPAQKKPKPPKTKHSTEGHVPELRCGVAGGAGLWEAGSEEQGFTDLGADLRF